MAEILGLVSSVITVAELAGRIASATLALKKLWSQVKEVPETINHLLLQLDAIHPILAGFEYEILQREANCGDANVINPSLICCRRAVADLENLVQDMYQQISSARGFKGGVAKVRVTIKSQHITTYQERLKSALQLLSLSQQSYLITLLKTQPFIFMNALKERLESENIAQSKQAKSESISKNTNQPAIKTRTSNVNDSTSSLYHIRLQLPTWMCQKAWDFQLCGSSNGWKLQLKYWCVRPSQTEIFEHVREGSILAIMGELDSGRGSKYDKDPWGWSLLHFAAIYGHLDVFKRLMDLGVPIDQTDKFGATPIYYLGRSGGSPEAVLDIYRFLFSQGVIDFAVDKLFLPNYRDTRKSSLHRLVWKIPGLLGMVTDELVPNIGRMPATFYYGAIIWSYVDPNVLLGIVYQDQHMSPAKFRQQMDISCESSLHLFATKYFENSVHSLGACDYDASGTGSFDPWRQLARWIFTDITAEERSRTSCRPWERVTPLFAALCRFQTKPSQSPLKMKSSCQQLLRSLRMWLEDLQASGADLVKYGQDEMRIFNEDKWLQQFRWFDPARNGTRSGPQLKRVFYSSNPKYWDLIWDHGVEAFAGEFWNLIEIPVYTVPGAWIE